MNNYKEIEKVCATFLRGFEAIKQYALEFATAHKSIKKGMDKILKSGPEQIAMEYEIQNAFLYMIAEVFQSPKILKQLRTKHDAALTSEGRQVLLFWEENPAFWCYFTVKEHVTGDFWMIVDHMSGEEHLLHSQGVSTMQTWRNPEGLSFLCIMQPNGKCLQTVGVIKQYRLPVADFLFYSTLFKPEEGLQEILHKHFVEFFTLDKVSSAPPHTIGIYNAGFLWQSFTLPEFAIEKLGGRWLEAQLGDHQRFTIKGADPTMLELPNFEVFQTEPTAMAGAIIRDNATGEMGLFTNTEVSYAFFSTLLNRSYPELQLPEKPAFNISAPLQAILITMDIPLPWTKFEEIIEYDEPREMVESDRTKLWEGIRDAYRSIVATTEEDQLIKDMTLLYIDAEITGEPMDIDAVCKVTGLDREAVEGIRGRLDHLFDPDGDDEFDEYDQWDDEDEDEYYIDRNYIVPDEDKSYELESLPELDDLFGDFIEHSLPDSEIFVILLAQMDEAHRLFLQLVSEEYAQEIKSYGMLRSLERLFFSTFDERLAYPVMNTFFWILQHMGREWLPVRSYAIEMLKWIPSEILHFYAEPEEFIETFSKFVKNLLCTRGVCSLAKRPTAAQVKGGTYTIKGTDAFYTLLKVREEDD